MTCRNNLPQQILELTKQQVIKMTEPRKYKITGVSGEDFEVERLLLNRMQTPDGTVLTSWSRHDYRTYTDANGET